MYIHQMIVYIHHILLKMSNNAFYDLKYYVYTPYTQGINVYIQRNNVYINHNMVYIHHIFGI